MLCPDLPQSAASASKSTTATRGSALTIIDVERARPRALACCEIISFGYALLSSYKTAQELASKVRQFVQSPLECRNANFQKRWRAIIARMGAELPAVKPETIEQQVIARFGVPPSEGQEPLRTLLTEASDRATEMLSRYEESRKRFHHQLVQVIAFYKTLGADAQVAENLGWMLRSHYLSGTSFVPSTFSRSMLATLLATLPQPLTSLDSLVREGFVMKPAELLSAVPEPGVPEVDLCQHAVRILKRFGRAESEIEASYRRFASSAIDTLTLVTARKPEN